MKMKFLLTRLDLHGSSQASDEVDFSLLLLFHYTLPDFSRFFFYQLTLNVCADCSEFLYWLALNFSVLLTLDPLPSLLMMIWMYILLKTCWSQFQRNDYTKGTLNLSKFINHSRYSVHSTNLINFDFHDHHLFAIRKVRGIINHLMLRAYFYQVKSWLPHLNLGRIC